MMKKEKIAVLYGGKSGEHEISLRSAASVMQQLNRQTYDILPVAIDKQGCFFVNDCAEMLTFPDQLPVQTASSKPLPSLMNYGKPALDADIYFPVLHGPLYEDGCIQGILETMSVPFVGCGVLASSIGMDKDMSRRVLHGEGIPYANYHVLHTSDSESQKQRLIENLVRQNQWPLFVKPSTLGSSVGIHKVENQQALIEAIKDAFRFDETVLIEEFIAGQEIEVAVIENLDLSQPPMASTPGEIKTHHQDGFYSYNAKYCQSETSELFIPAQINPEVAKHVQQLAIAIFKKLKCQGFARIDFFVNQNNIYFNEINTIPGFTSISMFAKLWQYDGLAFPQLLDHLIQLAKKHYQAKSNRITNYQ